MPLPVSTRIPFQFLAQARIAKPVSTSVGEGPQQVMALLHGRCKGILGANAGLPGANGTVRWSYRHEAANAVMVVSVRLNPTTAAGNRATVTVSLNGSTTALTGTTDSLAGGPSIGCPSPRMRVPPTISKYFPLTGLTVGTVYDLVATCASATGTAQGIYSLSAYVVPRDVLDPENNPTTDQGVAFYFPRGDNPIFAGSASSAGDAGGGIERYWYDLDQWRTYSARYPLQIATLEDDTYAWNTTSAAFATLSTLGTARFYCRPQRFYTTATKANYTARIRYKSSDVGTLRIAATSKTTGTLDNNDIALASTAGAYAWTTGAVVIATDGVDQEAYLDLTAKITSGTLRICSIALYPAET